MFASIYIYGNQRFLTCQHINTSNKKQEKGCVCWRFVFLQAIRRASNCAAAKPAAQETSPRFRRMEMDLDVQHTYNKCFQCLITAQQFAYGLPCVENMCFNSWNSQIWFLLLVGLLTDMSMSMMFIFSTQQLSTRSPSNQHLSYTSARWHVLSRTYPKNHLCTCHLLEASEHTLSLKHMSSARWTVQCLWCVGRKQMTCALCSLRFAGCFFIFKFLFKNYWFAAIFGFCQKFPFLLVAFSFSNPFEKYFETYWFAVFFDVLVETSIFVCCNPICRWHVLSALCVLLNTFSISDSFAKSIGLKRFPTCTVKRYS